MLMKNQSKDYREKVSKFRKSTLWKIERIYKKKESKDSP